MIEYFKKRFGWHTVAIVRHTFAANIGAKRYERELVVVTLQEKSNGKRRIKLALSPVLEELKDDVDAKLKNAYMPWVCNIDTVRACAEPNGGNIAAEVSIEELFRDFNKYFE